MTQINSHESSKRRSRQRRVLAIDPIGSGFGFAVLEGPSRLVDWGITSVARATYRKCLRKVEVLNDTYQPDVIVVQRVAEMGVRRGARARRLVTQIESLCLKKQLRFQTVARNHVGRAFYGMDRKTKHNIAQAIAERFPELLPHLPKRRKPWMSEDQRMAYFAAIAFGLAVVSAGKVTQSPVPPADYR